MKECANPACKNTDLVYSGVDAFILQVETEKWCYTCANAILQFQKEKEVESVSN